MPGRATAPGFFMRARQGRENRRAGIVFHCSGMVFHCYCGLGVTARRAFCPHSAGFCAAATAGIIVNSLLLTMAGRWTAALEALSADRAPYPPRAARNSCGVVPVCLRKNRAK